MKSETLLTQSHALVVPELAIIRAPLNDQRENLLLKTEGKTRKSVGYLDMFRPP
jgi:hypothetical protein